MALPLGLLLAPVSARLLGLRLGHALWVCVGSVGLHDLLDLLQSSDRLPLWPLSARSYGPAAPWLPSGLAAESLLFGGIAASTWWWRHRSRWRSQPARTIATPAKVHGPRAGAILMAVLVAFAAFTSWLRDRRESYLRAAHYKVEHGDPRGCLALVDQAEAWPSAAKPGRIDYLRGAAYNALGDRDAAERFYLLTLQQDPSYFWAVADLAEFYAEGGGSVAQRRQRSAPYVERLRRDFADEAQMPAVLARVAGKLESARRDR